MWRPTTVLLWDSRGVRIAACDTNSGTVQYIFLRETTESRVADPCGVSELEQALLENMLSVHLAEDDPVLTSIRSSSFRLRWM
jgi:hypothetical protein